MLHSSTSSRLVSSLINTVQELWDHTTTHKKITSSVGNQEVQFKTALWSKQNINVSAPSVINWCYQTAVLLHDAHCNWGERVREREDGKEETASKSGQLWNLFAKNWRTNQLGHNGTIYLFFRWTVQHFFFLSFIKLTIGYALYRKSHLILSFWRLSGHSCEGIRLLSVITLEESGT